MDVNLSKPGIVKQREASCATAHGVAELDTTATEQRIGNLISEDLFYWARARIWNPELELPTSCEQRAQRDKFWRLCTSQPQQLQEVLRNVIHGMVYTEYWG